MHEVLSQNLVIIPGVTDFEIIHILKILKFSMDFIDVM